MGHTHLARRRKWEETERGGVFKKAMKERDGKGRCEPMVCGSHNSNQKDRQGEPNKRERQGGGKRESFQEALMPHGRTWHAIDKTGKERLRSRAG